MEPRGSAPSVPEGPFRPRDGVGHCTIAPGAVKAPGCWWVTGGAERYYPNVSLSANGEVFDVNWC